MDFEHTTRLFYFYNGKVSLELELIGTPAPSTKYEKLTNNKRVETCLGWVADILQCFNSHSWTNRICNASTPVRPPRSTAITTTGPKLYHCLLHTITTESHLHHHLRKGEDEKARKRVKLNSLMNDQIKHTTFCAKLRNERCSNLFSSGPNLLVDLYNDKKQVDQLVHISLVASNMQARTHKIRKFESHKYCH